MRAHCLSAAIVVAFSCVLSASCLQATAETDATARPTQSIERVSEPGGPEPIEESSQPMGHLRPWYGSKDFRFVVWIEDDGEGKGGGSQRSIMRLGFVVLQGIQVIYEWECPIEIDVPLRTELLGRITPSRASLWTAEAADLAARLLMDSRAPDEWRGQGEAYCTQLYPRLQSLMNGRHQGLGARVHRP